MSIPMVSVCMIAYNHELYIAEAIKGVLMQQTTFPIELIISEDCSTDNTRTIVREYVEKHPNIIVADLPEKNRGMMNNFHHCMSLAKGKYIALCEGDDYWTDPLKLQKQVDFLENYQEYSLCFHNAIVKYDDESGREDKLFAPLESREYSMQEISLNWIIPTASIAVRMDVISSELYQKTLRSKRLYTGDTVLSRCASLCGKLCCMSNTMSVYRVNSGGVSHTLNYYKLFSHHIETGRIFGKDYRKIIRKNIARHAPLFLSVIVNDGIFKGIHVIAYSLFYTPVLTIKSLLKWVPIIIKNKIRAIK